MRVCTVNSTPYITSNDIKCDSHFINLLSTKPHICLPNTACGGKDDSIVFWGRQWVGQTASNIIATPLGLVVWYHLVNKKVTGVINTRWTMGAFLKQILIEMICFYCQVILLIFCGLPEVGSDLLVDWPAIASPLLEICLHHLYLIGRLK